MKTIALSDEQAKSLVDLLEEDLRDSHLSGISDALRTVLGMESYAKVIARCIRQGKAKEYARAKLVCAERFGIPVETSVMTMVDITLARCNVLADKPVNWRDARELLISMHGAHHRLRDKGETA